VVVALVVALLAAVPAATGTSWRAVGASWRAVSLRDAVGLAVLWWAGLWCYSWVLTAALPGLSRGRALLLNVTGSSVANVLPFGGAAGVGMNYAMARAWGFSRRSFATFTAVSNVSDVASKVTLAALALTWALLSGALTGSRLLAGVGWAFALVVLLALALAVVLSSRAVAVFLGRTVSHHVPELRAAMLRVMRHGWRSLTLGALGYVVLQGALLWACFTVVGGTPTLSAVLLALAIERLFTLVPVLPSGAGAAEAVTAAVLVALGTPPVTAAATVLLYRSLVFLLEVPVGALGVGGWLLHRRVRAARVPC
jgi:uncharacterized membrane protein YbhN (UPF0104 family)